MQGRISGKHLGMLAAIFLIALLPRLYSAQNVGWDWFTPGGFTPINFDEANTCRRALNGLKGHSPVIGYQTIGISSMLGYPPPQEAEGDAPTAKAYCMSGPHMLVARSFSAVLGAATAVVLSLIALCLSPGRPQVGWTAGILLALSGVHATQSHMATVDAAMTFYTYTFILVALVAARTHSLIWILLSLSLALLAVFAKKIWPFPLLAYLVFLPIGVWRWLGGQMNQKDILVLLGGCFTLVALTFNTGFQQTDWWPLLLGMFYIAIPWRRVNPWTAPVFLLMPVAVWAITLSDWWFLKSFTSGSLTSRFGSGFGAIGWNKFERNLINFPVFFILSLGIPAAMLIPKGCWAVLQRRENWRLWLCFLPVLAWAAYMLFVAPRTTYRHYLPLLPMAALLAAYGYWSLRSASSRILLGLFFTWPALLLMDFQQDFHNDPRRQAAPWYAQHQGAKLFISFYASPPPTHRPRPRLFREEYAMEDAAALRQGDFLILSENWYETTQAQELNGLRVNNLERLVKTTPEKALLYRDILAGRHPNLTLEREYTVSNFMPELVLHKKYYGTFQKFVGDLKIYRIGQ